MSRYTLNFGEQKLEGALLRDTHDKDHSFSLLQPWPSLGDADLEAHLRDLSSGQKLPLTQRAVALLETEQSANKDKRDLYPKSIERLPPSHALVHAHPDSLERLPSLFQSGIRKLKIKIGVQPDLELEFLQKIEGSLKFYPFKIRLDANMRGNLSSCTHFFSQCSDSFLSAVDFVEDPFRGSPEEWKDFAQRFDLRLAHDFAPAEFRDVCDVWILKPSRENPWPLVERAALEMKRIVVTTALDPLLGQVIAVSYASEILHQHPLLIDEGGLLSVEGQPLNLNLLSGHAFGLASWIESQNYSWEAL